MKKILLVTMLALLPLTEALAQMRPPHPRPGPGGGGNWGRPAPRPMPPPGRPLPPPARPMPPPAPGWGYRPAPRPAPHPGYGRFHDRDQWWGHRYDRWNARRAIIGGLIWGWRSQLPQGEIMIGYGMLSDDYGYGYDYEHVEVLDQSYIDEVKIQVQGDSADIQSFSVRYCNGQEQTFYVNSQVWEGGSTMWYPIGYSQCVSSFSVLGKGNQYDDDETTVVLVGKRHW